MKKRLIGLLFLFGLCGCLHAQTNAVVQGIDTLQWKGFDRHVLKFTSHGMQDTLYAFVTAPTKASKGNPWVWRARFPEWHTEMDSILLSEGFHIAYIKTDGMYGSPRAVKIWNQFYGYLASEWGLNKKVALEGVSRGGLFVYNWAKRNPDKVSCIYAEAPVCDFKSWPAGLYNGKTNEENWHELLAEYGFASEQDAIKYTDNPIDNLQGLAAAKIPILHMIGLDDKIVPPKENTFKLIENYLKLGGIATVVPCTKGKQSLEGHHFPIESPRYAADFIKYSYLANLGSRIMVNNADEIRQAMQTAHAGDTLIMSNGVWKDQQIVFDGNGTAALPIVLMAQTPGKVILSGESRLHIAGSHLLVDGLVFKNGCLSDGSVIEFRNGDKTASNCRLTNTVIDAYNPLSDTVDYKWVSLYGTHNRVDHCAIQGKNHQGPTLVVWLDGKPNYHKIDHNYFGPMLELGRNGAETIRIGTSGWSKTDSYTTVEYNYFDNVDGEIETISNKSGHNTIQYNTFYHCKGTITLRHGNDALIKGNVFLGGNKLGTGGIRVIGENHVIINNYFQNLNPGDEDLRAAISIMNAEVNPKLTGYWQVKNVLIANNTLINNTKNIVVGSGANERRVLPPLDSRIYNNLVFGNSGQLITFRDKPIGFSFKKNIIYGDTSGIRKQKGLIIIKPQLVKTNGAWRLAEDSPAIDFGQVLKQIEYDIDGQSRNDGFIDIGADEYSGKTEKRSMAPISPDEVGPGFVWQILK